MACLAVAAVSGFNSAAKALVPEVIEDPRASADRKRVLNRAGDIALCALDGVRYVVSEREPGGNR